MERLHNMRYVLFLGFFLYSVFASGQISIIQFNAVWNNSNSIDIAENTEAQKKHKIVVVPTIIVLRDGEEVKRFQADISFSMKATKKEVQEAIDEELMSDF